MAGVSRAGYRGSTTDLTLSWLFYHILTLYHARLRCESLYGNMTSVLLVLAPFR